MLGQWIATACNGISPQSIVKGVKKCCVSNNRNVRDDFVGERSWRKLFFKWWKCWQRLVNMVMCLSLVTTIILTYCMEQSPSWQAKRFSASQEISTFYRTQRFITTLTSAQHLSLSWASSIQPMPLHPTSWRSILILSSHLCLGFPSGLFLSGFPTKILYAPHLSPKHATCPTNPNLPDLITWIIFDEEYRSPSSSLCSFPHCPVTSSFLGLNILLSTLFSNTLSLHFSSTVSDQVAHPYETRGKIISSNFVITNWKTKDSALNDRKHSLTLQ